MKKFLFLCLLPLSLAAQRTYEAPILTFEPEIDGILDTGLTHLPITDGFTTSLPTFGKKPMNDTHVRMAYTKWGLYVYAECLGKRIRQDVTQRDQVGQADYFSFGLDTWHDGQNAFVFTVTPAGQRIDQRISSTETGVGFDTPWNLKTTVRDDRWTVEIYVPYAAIRYPRGQETAWGLQFTRFDRSTGQLSTWNPQDPLIEDQVLQYGVLEGLNDINGGWRLMGTWLMDVQSKNEGERINNGYENTDTIFINSSTNIKINTGSAGTLDFMFLPEVDRRTIDYRYTGLVPSLPGDGVVQQQSLFNNQLNEQDKGLLNKSGGLREYNFLAVEMITPKPFARAVHYDELPVSKRIQFAYRTRRNWALVIRNDFYKKEAYYLSPTDYTRRYTDPVTHNYMAFEKAFRNNSWVHFSNSFYALDGVRYANQLGSSVQLRDKTNRYELSASGRLQSQGGFSVADGSVSLAKVNDAIIYGVTYDSPVKTRPYFLMPYKVFVDEKDPHKAAVYWGKRSYRPVFRGIQNFAFVTKLEAKSKAEGIFGAPLAWHNTLSATDNKFRQLELGMVVYPVAPEIQIRDFDLSYYLGSGQHLGVALGASTDSRRKWVVNARYQNQVGFKSAAGRHQLDMELVNAITPRVRMRLTNRTGYDLQRPFHQTLLGGARQLEVANRLEVRTRIELYGFIANEFNIGYSYTPSFVLIHNRALYTLGSNGGFEASGYVYSNDPAKAFFGQHGIDLNWYIGRMSVFKFNVLLTLGDSYQRTFNSDAINTASQGKLMVNVGFVTNINGF